MRNFDTRKRGEFYDFPNYFFYKKIEFIHLNETEYIEYLLEGERRHEEIKGYNAAGTWSSFQSAYLSSLLLWDVTGAKVFKDSAFAFKVNTEKYAPGWVIVTMNADDFFRIYFVSEGAVIYCAEDVYISDLARVIDEEICVGEG